MPCHVHGTNRKIWIPMRSWILDLQLFTPSTRPVPTTMSWWWARPLITTYLAPLPQTACRLSTPDINYSVNQNNSVTRPFLCSRVREGNPVWISKFSHQQPTCSEPRDYLSMSVHLFLSLQLVSQSINLPQTKLQTSEYTAVSVYTTTLKHLQSLQVKISSGHHYKDKCNNPSHLSLVPKSYLLAAFNCTHIYSRTNIQTQSAEVAVLES